MTKCSECPTIVPDGELVCCACGSLVCLTCYLTNLHDSCETPLELEIDGERVRIARG